VSLQVAFLGARLRGGKPQASHWRLVLVMSLAGVRGAITLAGVLTLPLTLGDGTPLPGRDIAIFLAAGVIVMSLVLATVALPRALRGLDRESESDQARRVAENRMRSRGGAAAIRAIESAQKAAASNRIDADLYEQVSMRLIERYRQRIERYASGEDVAVPAADVDRIERELRLLGLRAEREEILRVGQGHGVDELLERKLVREIDLQEAQYSG